MWNLSYLYNTEGLAVGTRVIFKADWWGGGFSGEVCAIHLPKVSVVDCRWLDGDKWGTRLAKVVTMKIDSIQGVEEE